MVTWVMWFTCVIALARENQWFCQQNGPLVYLPVRRRGLLAQYADCCAGAIILMVCNQKGETVEWECFGGIKRDHVHAALRAEG